MKPLTKVLILILICSVAILMGCADIEYIGYSNPGFNSEILKEKSLEIDKQATITEFKGDLMEFKSFSDEIFPVWADHIQTTSFILDDFNSSTVMEEKSGYSKLLERRYLEFKVDLENIKPPAIAEKAYGFAIEGVSCRVLFFKKFNENAPVKELNEIEGKAYIAEVGFWDEIDNIYRYFDKEMASLDAENDKKFIAFE